MIVKSDGRACVSANCDREPYVDGTSTWERAVFIRVGEPVSVYRESVGSRCHPIANKVSSTAPTHFTELGPFRTDKRIGR